MTIYRLVVVAFVLSAVSTEAVWAQAKTYPLATTDGLVLHNTTAEAVTFKDKPALRVGIAPDVSARPEYVMGQIEPETFVRVSGVEFSNGTIEVEVASAPAEGSYPGARGFAGLAFRLQAHRDPAVPPVYDAFYLRPTNGRAEDQERRNHSVQYISHPEWTWSRLRRETPSRYEAYADLEPDTWTAIRLEIDGVKARLYVNGMPQPVLLVNDVKSGPSARGAVALWIGPGTVAYFRNLVIRPH